MISPLRAAERGIDAKQLETETTWSEGKHEESGSTWRWVVDRGSAIVHAPWRGEVP